MTGYVWPLVGLGVLAVEIAAFKTRRFPTFTRWVQANTPPQLKWGCIGVTMAGAAFLSYHFWLDDPIWG